MINKNQYKVRNVKKILHKVGKNWLVVSTALLGMVAGGAVAGTATHADTTPVNANHSNGYVNHQMTQSAGSASPQLVRSDGTSLASVSANSSVASNNVSPSASKSTVSSAVPSASSAVQLTRPQQRLLGQTPSAPKSVSFTAQEKNKTNHEFNEFMNNIISLNASSSFGQSTVTSALIDFRSENNASAFASAFTKDDSVYTENVGPIVNENIKSLCNSPIISSVYQDLHNSNETAGENILQQLLQISPNTEVSSLSGIVTLIKGNFSNSPSLLSMASSGNTIASNTSNFDGIIDSLVDQDNVYNTINSIVHNTSNNRDNNIINHIKTDFDNIVSKVRSSNSSKKISNDEAFNDFTKLLDSYQYLPQSIKSLLNTLSTKSINKLASKYFYNFVQNYTLVDKILSGLPDVTNDLNSYKNNLKNIFYQLNDLNNIYDISTLSDNLDNVIPEISITSAKSSSASSTTDLNSVTSGSHPKSASPSGTNHSTQSSNPVKPNGSSDDGNGKSSTNSHHVNPSGHPKSVPSASTNNSAKPSDSVKPNGSNGTSSGNKNSKASTNNNASYLASLSNSKAEQSTSASEASVSNSISASKASASASAAASESSEEAAKSFLNSIINNNAQSNNKASQTPSSDDNNSSSPSKSNGNGNNNTSDSSSNDDSNSASQSQFSFTDNASTPSSSAVQSSASSSTKDNLSGASNVNQLSVGQRVDYHGMTVTRKRPTYRWFEISKTCLAHNTLDSVGKVKDYGAVLSPGMKVRLDKIFKVNVGHRTVYRYEININGHDYFVTGNHHFTNDAYYRASDFKGRRAHGRYGHRYFEAIVKKPFMVYDSSRFDKDNQLWKSRRGQLIDIKGVHKVGNVTRLALIDGTYITANREFLKLI